MLPGRAVHDVVARATRKQPEMMAAVDQASRTAPRIKDTINQITSAMAEGAMPRNLVIEEFKVQFPHIFQGMAAGAAVTQAGAAVQSAHGPMKQAAVQPHPMGLHQAADPHLATRAKHGLAGLAEKALFIAVLENAIDEAEGQSVFSLAQAIADLQVRLDGLTPDRRHDLLELQQMMDLMQKIMESTSQMNMSVIQNLR